MSQQFCLICGYPVHKIGKDSYGHDLPQGRLYSTQMEEFPECWNDPKVSDPAIHLRTSLKRIAELESQQAADREVLKEAVGLLVMAKGAVDGIRTYKAIEAFLDKLSRNPAAAEGGR